MSTTLSVQRGSTSSGAPASPSGSKPQRDTTVDLARAWCLTVVVALHALMVGVSVSAAGPVLVNAMESWPWLAPVSWIVQVMPLFVVLGGFSSYTQWTRLRSRGVRPDAYVAQRMRRLLGPAVVAVVAVVVGLAGLTAGGVPADLVATAGFRLSQPLWFLGVYILCSAFVPVMAWAHGRAPVLTVVGLTGVVVAVDVVRLATGVTAIGFANLLFVWLLIQQFGFWLADGQVGRIGRMHRLGLGVLAAVALVALFVLAATGLYSFDMLANLNPPTLALVLLGVAQLAVFESARPALRRLHRIRPLSVAVDAVNGRAMTIYLWHMPVLIALAGVLLVSGARLPVPLSGEWWLSRPLWLVAVAVAVAAVVALAGRVELRRPRESGVGAVASGAGMRVRSAAPSVSAALGAGGVLVLLLTGISPAGGVLGAALLATALRLLSPAKGDCDRCVRECPLYPPHSNETATLAGSGGESRPISSSGIR